jgi:hypothetical protein
MMIRTMLTAVLLLGCFAMATATAESPLGGAVQVQAQTQPEESGELEGATPADRSPLADLNPAESSWRVWAGPVAIGVFGLILVFLIRRFSLGGRNGARGGRDDDNAR